MLHSITRGVAAGLHYPWAAVADDQVHALLKVRHFWSGRSCARCSSLPMHQSESSSGLAVVHKQAASLLGSSG